MGEFLVPAAPEFPLQLVLSIVCSAALGVYALLQPGEGSDDDDNGSGGGGLMQPVAMGAR
jgi:preprotein translocase subunit SecG